MDKAAASIDAANTLLEAGHLEPATSRSYYAMFYVAEALLASQGLRFSKHGGVHSAFGQHLVKEGSLDAKYHRWLLDSFDRRIQADYGFDTDIRAEEVKAMIRQAKSFLIEARKHLGIE